MKTYLLVVLGFGLGTAVSTFELRGQEFAHVPKVFVSEASRLDWVYALTEKSPAEPPADLTPGYIPHRQSYEYFGPTESLAGEPHALVIDISPQNNPKGWYFWELICRHHQVVYAGLREMGNGVPLPKRARAVLDVLDDVRSKTSIDSERTYLVGFSGGAPVACQVAFRLPEYFGGIICLAAWPNLPDDPWLIDRVAQKLGVVLIAGEREMAGPLNREVYGPLYNGIGIQTKVIVMRRRGHVMPETDDLAEAFAWLEEGLQERREIAKKFPATSMADAPNREEFARRIFVEAQARLANPKLINSGLNQLDGITKRWPDLPQADESKMLLAKQSVRDKLSWEVASAKRRTDSLRFEAAGYERLARQTPKPLKSSKRSLTLRAMALWQQLANESLEQESAAEANNHLHGLQELVAAEPAQLQPPPLNRFRFNVVGTVTLDQGIEYFRRAVEPLGYQVLIDDTAAQSAHIDHQREYKLNLPAGRISDIESRFFHRAGLNVVIDGPTIRLVPRKAPQKP